MDCNKSLNIVLLRRTCVNNFSETNWENNKTIVREKERVLILRPSACYYYMNELSETLRQPIADLCLGDSFYYNLSVKLLRNVTKYHLCTINIKLMFQKPPFTR